MVTNGKWGRTVVYVEILLLRLPEGNIRQNKQSPERVSNGAAPLNKGRL
jgi:hypothetical protein